MINWKALLDRLKVFNKPPPLLGIDINDQFLSLIELATDGENLKVISYAMEQLPINAIVNGEIKQSEIVTEHLLSLLKKASTKTKSVAIAVSGSSVITKVISMVVNTNEETFEAKIIADAEKYIPYALEDVAIDYSIIKTDDTKESEILLAACRREIIDQRVEILSAVGLETSIVDIKIYDIERSFSLLKKEYSHGSHEVVALFEHNTGLSLTVLQQGVVIYHKEESFAPAEEETPGSINLIEVTDENEVIKRVNDAEGEACKRQLAQQMKSAIQFFISSSQHEKIDRVFLAGSFISIKEFAVWLDNWLKIPTSVADPFRYMSLAEKVDRQDIHDHAASLLVACGLAMRGSACQ
ncbi:MAG: hypothetical protein CL692_01345 [Cellvibrionales bacterium]|nr:hypothetical protein [Cellvibrionales bacterium]